MDLSTILVKITGVVLLIWTGFSIFKHVQEKRRNTKTAKKEAAQSLSEQVLNNLLLYLWLAFMVVFSVGMMVNN